MDDKFQLIPPPSVSILAIKVPDWGIPSYFIVFDLSVNAIPSNMNVSFLF